MNKRTTVYRLAVAMSNLLTRIVSYCDEISACTEKKGICVIYPKEVFSNSPSQVVLEELKKRAKEHFNSLGLHIVYCHYFTPPASPQAVINERTTIADDYTLIFKIVEFDQKWEQKTLAQSLIYCPAENEKGEWIEWFSKQDEAIRNIHLYHRPLKKRIEEDMCRRRVTSKRKPYEAKRPALCISYLQCAQVLYSIIRSFCTMSKKNEVLGEVALFIWICQHAAFSDAKIDVTDVLAIQVTDVDYCNNVIHVKNQEIDITKGLSELLAAWLGKDKRLNKRCLLPKLTLDRLEDNLKKQSKALFGADNGLRPADFLMKVHPVAGVCFTSEIRRSFDYHEIMFADSPYYIDDLKIKKEIMKSANKKHVHK